MKYECTTLHNGFHWVYESEITNERLSIIKNYFSYGNDKGLFETQCSWLSDVQGYLTFGQVQRKIDTIYKRESKAIRKG